MVNNSILGCSYQHRAVSMVETCQHIVICAVDAGSARHIAAWMYPLKQKVRLCVDGPAVKIFKEAWGIFDIYDLAETVQRCDVLISGTGWSSDLEHYSRIYAKQFGVRSIAVLDHWVNYSERFRRGDREVLPDELWVSDAKAFEIARQHFPRIPIVLLPNIWLDSVTSYVKKLRKAPSTTPYKNLLYLCEPIREEWGYSLSATYSCEEQAILYWLKGIGQLVTNGLVATKEEGISLLLLPHPSEESNKYKYIVEHLSSEWQISIAANESIETSVAWADAVFGCETQGLIIAVEAELPTYSCLPPWAPKCRLPCDRIVHMKDLLRDPLTLEMPQATLFKS